MKTPPPKEPTKDDLQLWLQRCVALVLDDLRQHSDEEIAIDPALQRKVRTIEHAEALLPPLMRRWKQ